MAGFRGAGCSEFGTSEQYARSEIRVQCGFAYGEVGDLWTCLGFVLFYAHMLKSYMTPFVDIKEHRENYYLVFFIFL